MNKKVSKKGILILSIIMLIISISSISMANTQGKDEIPNIQVKTQIQCDKNKIGSEEKIKLSFKIEPTQEIKQYINVYKARIEYDKNVFEELTENDFSVCNSWTSLKYNPESREFVVINFNEISEKDDVVNINLKTKKNIENIKEANIKISNIETGNWNTKEDLIVYTTNEEKEQNILLNIENKMQGDSILNKEQGKEENIHTGVIPKLGENNIKIIVTILSSILIIIIIINFIKMKKIKGKLFTVLFAIILSTSMLSNTNVNANARKGDINGDGIIDIKDIEILEKHLIKLNATGDINLMDMNEDGKISISDLSILVHGIDDNNKDDNNKGDSNKEDNNKEDNNKDDSNKEDNNKDDSNKEDSNKDDSNKDDNDKDTPTVEQNTKTAIEAVKEMKLGWNLGNSLDSCNYQKKYIGEQKAIEYYETAWGNPVTTKEMIDEVKKAGFESVRLPVTYYDHIKSDGTIDEKWFTRVKEVVGYILENDMYCILDVHHDTGLYPNGSWIVADANKYEENAKKLSGLWTQIAEQFKEYDYRLIFEGFNEIVDTKKNYDWVSGYANTINVNKLSQVFVDTVRKTGGKNADRFLVVTTFGGITDDQKLSTFVMPKDSAQDKIILALHDYSNSEKGIDNLFARVKKHCTDKNIPVILDEFGLIAKSASEDRRAQIANYYVSSAKNIGVTCFWWDNGNPDEYAILNRKKLNWQYPKVKDALVNCFK